MNRHSVVIQMVLLIDGCVLYLWTYSHYHAFFVSTFTFLPGSHSRIHSVSAEVQSTKVFTIFAADSRTELYDNPLKRPSHSPYLGEHLSLSSGEQRGEALSVWPDLVPSSDRRGYPAYKDLSDASSLFPPHRPAVLLAHQTGQDLSTPFHGESFFATHSNV